MSVRYSETENEILAQIQKLEEQLDSNRKHVRALKGEQDRVAGQRKLLLTVISISIALLTAAAAYFQPFSLEPLRTQAADLSSTTGSNTLRIDSLSDDLKELRATQGATISNTQRIDSLSGDLEEWHSTLSAAESNTQRIKGFSGELEGLRLALSATEGNTRNMATLPDLTVDRIKVGHLSLVDDAGNVRATLEATPESSTFSLLDSRGRVATRIEARDGFRRFDLFNSDGSPNIRLNSTSLDDPKDDTAVVGLYSEGGIRNISGVHKGYPMLNFYGGNHTSNHKLALGILKDKNTGNIRTYMIFADHLAQERLVLECEEEEDRSAKQRFVIFDQDHSPLFSAPREGDDPYWSIKDMLMWVEQFSASNASLAVPAVVIK